MTHSVQVLTYKGRKVFLKFDTDNMNTAVLSFLFECLDKVIDTVEYFISQKKAYFDSDEEPVYEMLNAVAHWLLPAGYEYDLSAEFDYWSLYIGEE